MRYMQYVWLAIFLPSISFGAIDLDVDKNGATDVNRGGSNATTAAGARSNLGLGNVTNTSDANKPVSTAQQSALDLKSNITCFADASAFNACFGLDWITASGIGLGTSDNPSFASVHASGGNLAAANKQVTKAWATGLPYVADVTSVIHGGKHYICTSSHTAGSTTEPGVGASWATVWSEVSGAGDNLGNAAYSDVVNLWTTCTGYLKSDGTCDTPSGSATYPAAAGLANWTGSAWGTSQTLGTVVGTWLATPSGANLASALTSALPASKGGTGLTSLGTGVPTALGFAPDTAGGFLLYSTYAALPTLAFDSATLTTTTAGNTDTISVKANTFQAYDANMISWPSTISATEVGYLNGLTEAISTSLSGKQAADVDLTTYAGITPSANVQSLLGAANYAAMRTLLDLEAGTDFNAYDADIADLADGSLTASKVAGYAAATASKATTYTIGTDSVNESYGGTIYVTSATTITAPAVAAGMNFSVVTIGDIAVSLDVNAADKMILDGVTLANGDKATNSSKAGDTITCQYYSADGWYCWSGTVLGGHWTDGN